MSSFLFTATSRTQENVTSRIEADNLSQARQKLVFQGFTEITFFESELSSDTRKLFGDRGEQAKNLQMKQQVQGQYDSRLSTFFLNQFKLMSIPFLAALIFVVVNPSPISFTALGFIVFLYFYLAVPVVLFKLLFAAHCWNENRRLRVLAAICKAFNIVTINKIPESEIDVYVASADARDGDLKTALSRIVKYENDPKVSRRLYNTMLTRIFGNAKRYDKVLEFIESSLQEGHAGTEELIDYAVCLARRHKRTGEARKVLDRVFDKEFVPLAGVFITYCQGVIEVEDQNHSQAEFYLTQATKELEPYRHNSRLVGLRSEINAFLVIVLAKLGRKTEAIKIFQECRNYLSAIRETELLQRCEEAIS